MINTCAACEHSCVTDKTPPLGGMVFVVRGKSSFSYVGKYVQCSHTEFHSTQAGINLRSSSDRTAGQKGLQVSFTDNSCSQEALLWDAFYFKMALLGHEHNCNRFSHMESPA